MKRSKAVVSLLAIACAVIAIVTGVLLHVDVWHRYVYNNIFLWRLHEVTGLILAALIVCHCRQHLPWFRNHKRIPLDKKRASTLFLIIAIVETVTGIILMCGSRSHLVSRIHFVCGILFILCAAGHVVKRLKMLRALLKG